MTDSYFTGTVLSNRMKVLLALLFVGLASAAYVDVLDKASQDVVVDFMVGMENGPALREALGYELAEEADQIEDDIKTQLGKTLKESLDAVLEQIRKTVDHGKEVGNELVNKAKEIAQKLKELGLDAGEKAKELLERIKQKAKDWLRALLEKLGIGKRGLIDWVKDLLSKLDYVSIFQKLKEKLAEKINLDAIIEYITKLFGHQDGIKGALIQILKEKGLAALKNLLGKLIPVGDGSYSLAEMWESIKDFFKDLGVQIKEKFGKFSEWLKNTVSEGIDKAKDKISKLKQIAKEVLDHSKTLSKEAAREALEFFRPYKEDLGALWDQLKETVRRVIGRDDEF